MGIFKSSGNQRNPIQKSKIAQQQSNDMKYRARSKLIGALFLAIIAIIVLPMIFSNDKPINTNGEFAPLEPPVRTGPKEPVQVVVPSNNTSNEAQGTVVKPAPSTGTTSPSGQSIVQGTTTTEPTNIEEPIVDTKPAKPKEPKEPKEPVATKKDTKKDTKVTRTDDGSKARAILQGKEPPKTASNDTKKNDTKTQKNVASSGNYSVQVASLNNMSEARKLREKLIQSGVSNTFIQTASVNGKQTYRLRVGPFATKESAQAALARLRALGYSDGYIANK